MIDIDMENFKRTIFFWTLVVLFLLTAPVVVLRAKGYRFDMSRGVFVFSGSITIKSNPQDMEVSLNGEMNDSQRLNRINNSYNLGGLLPGYYDIKVSAPDFQTWSKKTDVHSGIASEFWNVLLVRNTYEKTEHPALGIEKFFTSPKNKYLAYTVHNKEEGILEINILNIEDSVVENKFDFHKWNLLSDSKKENVEWSSVDGNHLSIPVERESHTPGKESFHEQTYFIANIENNTSFDLKEFLNIDKISDVRWDPQEESYLFFLSESKLYRAGIQEKIDINLIAEDVSSFNLSKTNVYYVSSSNNIVYKTGIDGKNKEQVTYNFPEENRNIKKVIIYDDSRIAFIDSDRNLFIFNKGEQKEYFRKLGTGVEGVHFSDDGKKLLFWTYNEISAYFLRNWDVQPIRQENDLSNITRYSEEIRNVQWFKDYEHVIFSSGQYTKIIELDPRDHRNCMDFPSTTLKTPFIIYNSSLEQLFFTDEKDGKTNLFSIEFPETTALLGGL